MSELRQAARATMFLFACVVGTPDSVLPQAVSAQKPACVVDPTRELIITNLGVVNNPLRTTWQTDPAVDPRAASWTFGRLMQKVAGRSDAQKMVRAMLDKWVTDQVVNGQTIAARTKMQSTFIDPWLTKSGSEQRPAATLDLSKAPFVLSAIVNRLDLRDLSKHSAGEGRFVFEAMNANGKLNSMALILEYNMYAADQAAIDRWAHDWHALGALTVGTPGFNDALGAITDRFTNTGVDPAFPRNAPLLALRTGEATLDPLAEQPNEVPEFRQFQLNRTGTLLDMTPLDGTAMNSANGSARLADFINQNETAILAEKVAEKIVVPLSFAGASFRGGTVFGAPRSSATNTNNFWNAPGIKNPDARQKFSLASCNGCHKGETRKANLTHVMQSAVGVEATLSGYLAGITVADPVTGTNRTFNILAERTADLTALVCRQSARN